MATLTADTPIDVNTGNLEGYPVIASDIIYQHAFVGDNGSGYARPLVAGDPFLGLATKQVDNASGAAGAKEVQVFRNVRAKLAISGLAITDLWKDVYASDDSVATLTVGSNSRIGRVVKFISSGIGLVELQPGGGSDLPDHQHTSGADGGALTSPHIVTAIEDANGLELLKLTATASAVNEFTLANAATGNGPSLTASGETNVDATIAAKGTGTLTLGQATGSVQLGTVGTDLIGFYGTTPAAQPAHIADPAVTLSALTENSGAIGGTNDGDLPALVDPNGDAGATVIAGIRENATAINAAIVDIAANNTAIDAINAALATLGLTAAS